MKEKIQKMSKSFEGNMTSFEVMDTLKIARNTFYKYKKEPISELSDGEKKLLEEINA